MRKFHLALAGAVAAVSLLAVVETAQATTFDFNVTGGCSEACAANASITPGAGTLLVVLNDTEANPRSAGDLLSSIEITPSGSAGTPTLSSQAGSLITVTSTTGPYTTSPGPPTHWGTGASGSMIVLETAGSFAVGGAPINMIIGPPDGSGNYSSANSSITNGNFSPYINGTGTFDIADSAITAATTITGVTFDFGTTPDTFLVGSACTPGTPNCASGPPLIPEPSALALVGSALVLFGFVWRRRSA
jgi:PEP-CTERM motif